VVQPKEQFINVLKYGKCKHNGCDNPATKTHECPVGGSGLHATPKTIYCNCCGDCYRQCVRKAELIEEMFVEHAKNVQEEIDRAIIEEMKIKAKARKT